MALASKIEGARGNSSKVLGFRKPGVFVCQYLGLFACLVGGKPVRRGGEGGVRVRRG